MVRAQAKSRLEGALWAAFGSVRRASLVASESSQGEGMYEDLLQIMVELHRLLESSTAR